MSPVTGTEQTSHDRRRQVERDVPNDYRTVQRLVESIRVVNVHSREPGTQGEKSTFVDVYRTQWSIKSREVCCERTIAGADLQNGSVGFGDECGQMLEGRTVSEKVLAEFVSAARVRSRSQESAPKREMEHPVAACGIAQRTRIRVRGIRNDDATRLSDHRRAVRRGGRDT